MRTILYVDDNPKALRLLSSILERCEYKVLTAGNPQEALEVAKNAHFDLVILDYESPSTSGLSLAKAIRRIKPNAALLLFSGNSPVQPRELETVDEYVDKGETLSDLLQKMEHLLEPSTTDDGGHVDSSCH